MSAQIAIYITDRRAIVTRTVAGATDDPNRQYIDWETPVESLPREAAELRPIAAQIGAVLAQEFPHGAVARVVIPASWCFCEVLKIDPPGASEASLAYEFEDRLPVELERLTWATCRLDDDYACVAAIFTEAAEAFLDELEQHHIAVELLTVNAALSLSTPHAVVNNSPVLAGGPTMWFIGRGNAAAPLIRTFYHAADPKLVRQHQCLTLAQSGAPLGSEDVVHDTTLAEATFADRILNALRTQRSPLDLRRGELTFAGRWRPVRRKLIHCSVAAIGLLIVLSARLHWAAAASAHAGDMAAQLQDRIYERVFPGMSAPPGASLRVQAERKRLEGITRTGGSDGLPRSQDDLSLFQTLHELTARIPLQIRLHVNEIEVDAESIRASGQAATHASVGDWVQEINRSPRLRAEPPRTNLRKDGTVDFRVFAKREASSEPN